MKLIIKNSDKCNCYPRAKDHPNPEGMQTVHVRLDIYGNMTVSAKKLRQANVAAGYAGDYNMAEKNTVIRGGGRVAPVMLRQIDTYRVACTVDSSAWGRE